MENPYDRIPYLGRSHQQTHIEKIACIPFLFDIPFPDIHKARVLELGCGDGSNLINMAYTLPNATFIGIDGSLVQIERGLESIALADLNNIMLFHADLMEIEQSLGSFDYIICHGVYSWVPPQIREHILSLCAQLLSPEGIAYISYNALPGWRMFGMVRDMMRYHVRNIPEDHKKVEQSIAMLQFVGQHIVDPLDPYGAFVRETMNQLTHSSSEYIFHEYLEEFNQALYFHEFVESLTPHKLQYLGDTDFNTMNNLHFPEQTQDILNDISGNIYELEQYMDFLRNRRFRCDLIVHDNRELEREVTLDPFTKGFFTLSIFHSHEENISPEEIVQDILDNTYIESQNKSIAEIPIFTHSIRSLFEAWPHYLSFQQLCTIVETKCAFPLQEQEQVEIAGLLQTLLLRNTIELHLYQPTIAISITQTPCVSPVARAQIRYQNSISNQHHTMLGLKDPWMSTLLPFIDGNNSIETLCAIMSIHCAEDPILFPEGINMCAEKLNEFLYILWQKGVLVS